MGKLIRYLVTILVCLSAIDATRETASAAEQKMVKRGIFVFRGEKKLETKNHIERYQYQFETKQSSNLSEKYLLEVSAPVSFLRNTLVGKTLEASVEISENLDKSKSEVRISQMVVFANGVEGPTPVWIQSVEAGNNLPTSARMLDMHVPQADLRIF